MKNECSDSEIRDRIVHLKGHWLDGGRGRDAIRPPLLRAVGGGGNRVVIGHVEYLSE